MDIEKFLSCKWKVRTVSWFGRLTFFCKFSAIKSFFWRGTPGTSLHLSPAIFLKLYVRHRAFSLNVKSFMCWLLEVKDTGGSFV